MPLDSKDQPALMCLTQDGQPFSHVEQARRLCGAGAPWIQLRMKQAARPLWLETAREVATICRAHGAICIVNDDLEIALESGADGVHLGKLDLDWREARRRLGSAKILGGTVNDAHDATLVLETDCLDYVGIGPWRFTASKKNLAPVLGCEGVRSLVARLDGLPAWAIGGVGAADFPALRAAGAAGAAVCSALYRDGRLEDNYRELFAAWNLAANPLRS